LQAAKDFLESEGERVQREAEHYTALTQGLGELEIKPEPLRYIAGLAG